MFRTIKNSKNVNTLHTDFIVKVEYRIDTIYIFFQQKLIKTEH